MKKIPGRMPVSASLGPYGAQIPGSTGAFREDVDEVEESFVPDVFDFYVELDLDVNKFQVL